MMPNPNAPKFSAGSRRQTAYGAASPASQNRTSSNGTPPDTAEIGFSNPIPPVSTEGMPETTLTDAASRANSDLAEQVGELWNSASEETSLGAALQTITLLLAIALCFTSILLNLPWLGITAGAAALLIGLSVLWKDLRPVLWELISSQQRVTTLAIAAVVIASTALIRFTGIGTRLADWYVGLNWDAVGASGEVIGAIGQILIALLAVYVAWRQYVISKDLTIQQNLITQQQTIDSYFQGIQDLVLDEEGLLEDWPQERAIAEGRTAALLSSVDATGKAKVIRFLSRSKLLSPLKRDRILGRAILDGSGSYEEDRPMGIRVIDLGIMLAAANLSGTDLRWTDLSNINLIRANLRRADLVRANLSRTILCDADISATDLMGTRFFYGPAETATPRSRADLPDYTTGAHTGAVIENADFSRAERLSEEQRYYCCAWGGSKTRRTIPGGCEGIPNKLGR